MLSKEENDLITRTNAGTPMGELMRRFWVPALLSSEIPAPDSPPVQVRILGEELVAFRDSDGRIGLLDEHCPHRGTSLVYGRNEQCGLRCIYHGWKMDVEGNVLDTPAEPAASTFAGRVKQNSYATHEAGGMIFAYLGPKEKQPLFPNYFWTQLPVEQTYVTKCVLECNYLQGLEGESDSAHLSFLHRDFSREGELNPSTIDTSPKYEIEETDFGLRMIALRNPGPDQTYVRVSSFTPPVSCWIPARGKEVHFYTPIDDEHSWRFDFGFKTDRPVRPDEVHRALQIKPDFHRFRTAENGYLQDRDEQRAQTFTGIEDFLNHDACATESMGAIYDRTREHLGVSDKAVIAVRRWLIDAARTLQRGEEPPGLFFDAERNRMSHVDTIAEVVSGEWRAHFPHLTYSDPTLGPVTVGATK